MDESGVYEAGTDNQLMHVLETSVSRMRDIKRRKESEERLQRMRHD